MNLELSNYDPDASLRERVSAVREKLRAEFATREDSGFTEVRDIFSRMRESRLRWEQSEKGIAARKKYAATRLAKRAAERKAKGGN